MIGPKLDKLSCEVNSQKLDACALWNKSIRLTRSFSDASRASFAGLNTLSQILEKRLSFFSVQTGTNGSGSMFSTAVGIFLSFLHAKVGKNSWFILYLVNTVY